MADSASHPYPKDARLRRRAEFHRVVGRGEVFPGRQALVRRVANREGEARLGIATPRGYGKAVRRNTFRRLVREAFRHLRRELGAYDYLVSPRRNLERPTLEGVRADLLRTLTATPAPQRPRDAGRRRAGKGGYGRRDSGSRDAISHGSGSRGTGNRGTGNRGTGPRP